jgi:DHA3 family macrolide efflux protein-like MFS transporter
MKGSSLGGLELNTLNEKMLPKNWLAQFASAWTGQAFSLLGSQVIQFALIWWLTQTTGKATTLSIAALAGLLPQVLIAPLAGALVDRVNRKRVMVLADGLVALVTLGLVVLFWTARVQIWHVYLAMFLRAVAGSFQFPAWQASTSLMVPAEHLSRVQGFNQMIHGLLNICAPALAALLLSWLPTAQVLLVDILTAALAIGLIVVVKIPQPKITSSAGGAGSVSLWSDMHAGLRYVFSWTGLVCVTAIALLINLVVAPASALLPILVSKHFGGQAYELAWMESALGIGTIAGGLILGVWGGFRRRILTTLLGLVVLGVSFTGLGLISGNGYWLAVGMMLVTGLAIPIIDGPIMAAGQAVIPPEMQGRVFTLIGSLSALMTPIGLLSAGPLADRFGVQIWFVLGGIVTGLLGLGGFFIPAIVHFEDGLHAVPAGSQRASREVMSAPTDGD